MVNLRANGVEQLNAFQERAHSAMSYGLVEAVIFAEKVKCFTIANGWTPRRAAKRASNERKGGKKRDVEGPRWRSGGAEKLLLRITLGLEPRAMPLGAARGGWS